MGAPGVPARATMLSAARRAGEDGPSLHLRSDEVFFQAADAGGVTFAPRFGGGDGTKLVFFVDKSASRDMKQFPILGDDYHHVRGDADAGLGLLRAQVRASERGGAD